MISNTELSKVVSLALRHEPEQFGLVLDAEGWAPAAGLLGALHQRGGDWADLVEADLAAMIETSTKVRHELVGGRIRARYGHSTEGQVSYEPSPPPALLFHGTSPEAAATIRAEGLRPMGRQYVHLSADEATAQLVGRRKASEPVILTVRATDAAAAGIAFHRAGEAIWLADAVPARFIRP